MVTLACENVDSTLVEVVTLADVWGDGFFLLFVKKNLRHPPALFLFDGFP